DRDRNLLGIGRGENEDDVRRRLFQRLEERIEGFSGEVVNFVYDIDLVAGFAGRILYVLDDLLTDVVNARFRGGVHLGHVQAAPFLDTDAETTLAAGFRRGAVLRDAVEGAGEQAGRGRFSTATRPKKEVGVRDAAGLDGVLEGRGDRLLS